ncbi:Mycolic acid cyclopropane synthetase-domain-containing protein [Mycena olivaceomarginata]|nr:Mycolic acid cyclopropane synthetase-domain-containing protein [Mycena olivaceomarginata]
MAAEDDRVAAENAVRALMPDFTTVAPSTLPSRIVRDRHLKEAENALADLIQHMRKERCLRGEEVPLDELLDPLMEQEDLDSEFLRFTDGDDGTSSTTEIIEHIRRAAEDDTDDEDEPEEPEFMFKPKDAMAAAELLREIVQHRPDLDVALPLGRCLRDFQAAMVQEVEVKKTQSNITSFFNIPYDLLYCTSSAPCSPSAVIQILIANRDVLTAGTDTMLASMLAKGRFLTSSKFVGSLANSRENISAHYDLGNTMFSAFLRLQRGFNLSVSESLEDAQIRKVNLILKKANILPGQRVLEIGTGWGSLAIIAAKTFNCTVETVTLSSNQAALCKLNFPEWAGAFDRFISVEMIEHVGKDFFIEYWAVADWALKSDTGAGVVQGISISEARTAFMHVSSLKPSIMLSSGVASYDASVDLAQKWSWSLARSRMITDKIASLPWRLLPSFSFMVETLNKGSAGRLVVDSVLNIGPHYARTLREW